MRVIVILMIIKKTSQWMKASERRRYQDRSGWPLDRGNNHDRGYSRRGRPPDDGGPPDGGGPPRNG